MTLLETSNALQEALKVAAVEEGKLEKAKLSLAPMEEAAIKAHEEVNRLIAEFQRLTGVNIHFNDCDQAEAKQLHHGAREKGCGALQADDDTI
jgi:hypothetical protein